MESYIELAEKYIKLLKEQNQLLKDSIQREDEYSELNNKYINVCAKVDVYEEVLKNINNSLYPINESEYMSWHNDTRQAANEALSAGDGEKEPVKEIEYMPILTAELNEKEYKGMANVPVKVPMHLLNEKQAYNNHGQSLARLKERGGISIREALSLINCYHWNYYRGMEARKAVAMLNDLISQKEDKQ